MMQMSSTSDVAEPTTKSPPRLADQRWRHSSPLPKSQMRRRPRSQPRLHQEEWLHAAVAARWAEQVHHPHTFSMSA